MTPTDSKDVIARERVRHGENKKMTEHGSSDGTQNKFTVSIIALSSIVLAQLAVILFYVTGASVTAVAAAGGTTLAASFTVGVTGAKAAGYIRNTNPE
ncbi:hypothetical protein [Streptomyces prunicolor]